MKLLYYVWHDIQVNLQADALFSFWKIAFDKLGCTLLTLGSSEAYRLWPDDVSAYWINITRFFHSVSNVWIQISLRLNEDGWGSPYSTIKTALRLAKIFLHDWYAARWVLEVTYDLLFSIISFSSSHAVDRFRLEELCSGVEPGDGTIRRAGSRTQVESQSNATPASE